MSARAEFVSYFEDVWDGNFGLPHNEKELAATWGCCMDVWSEEGHEVDYNWEPTKAELAKWIVPRQEEEELYAAYDD